jgi:preprotein translocase subunit SecF
MRAIFRGEATFDFVGRAPLFIAISSALVLGSVLLTLVRGLNYGIDFAGGYELHVKFDKPVGEAEIRDLIRPVVGADARVQRFGQAAEHEFLILIREHGTVSKESVGALQASVAALSDQPLREWDLAESGESLRVAFGSPVAEEALRKAVSEHGLVVHGVTRGEREDEPTYVVSLVSLATHVQTALRDGLALPADADIMQRVEFVGPQVGAQLRNQGVMAVVWALFFILVYVGVRFDLFFAPGAIIALIHDVIITIGFFALFQLEFNLPIIAALLTIIGYSVNDTIVIYDRVRENSVRLRGRSLRALVNSSINETLSRTLLTSGTTLLVVAALLLFGGGFIRDFSIALFVGIVIGTYSTLGIATPTYIWLRERSEARATERKQTGRESVKQAV